jgi:hypothetical protein
MLFISELCLQGRYLLAQGQARSLGEICPGRGALAFDVKTTYLAVVKVTVSRVGEDPKHDRPELTVGFRGFNPVPGKIFPGCLQDCLFVGETMRGVHVLKRRRAK